VQVEPGRATGPARVLGHLRADAGGGPVQPPPRLGRAPHGLHGVAARRDPEHDLVPGRPPADPVRHAARGGADVRVRAEQVRVEVRQVPQEAPRGRAGGLHGVKVVGPEHHEVHLARDLGHGVAPVDGLRGHGHADRQQPLAPDPGPRLPQERGEVVPVLRPGEVPADVDAVEVVVVQDTRGRLREGRPQLRRPCDDLPHGLVGAAPADADHPLRLGVRVGHRRGEVAQQLERVLGDVDPDVRVRVAVRVDDVREVRAHLRQPPEGQREFAVPGPEADNDGGGV